MNYEQALEKLKKYNQEHILKYYNELQEEEQKSLLAQIEAVDFGIIDISKHEPATDKVEPISVYTVNDIKKNEEEIRKIGIESIKKGEVAAVLLAGGQGTRLGFDGPKGTLNIGQTRQLYIFECLINNLMDVVKQAGCFIPLFIMTSEKNNDATVAFFKEHNFFGYDESYVSFFVQEMAPSVDYNGKVYLEEKDRISLSPNGNGGWFTSLKKAGVLEENAKAGNVKWLNVFAVDNVCQRIADPLFVGATVKSGYVSGAKVIAKVDPFEKVGVMCLRNGKPSIVEYYELTEDMAYEKNENGEYAYNYGVILNYLFDLAALEKMAAGKMPLHVVEKKIPYMNDALEHIKPEEPNGYKFETLVLDMIEQLDNCLVYEVIREKEFAPIKNKTGVDSIESATALLVKNGVTL